MKNLLISCPFSEILESVFHKQILKFLDFNFQYNVGDFVYVEAKGGRGGASHIFHIESMFTSKEGVQTMYANQVLNF